MARRMRRRRPGRRDGPAAAGRCARPGRTCAGAAASGWAATSPLGLGDATGGAAGARRPRRARRDCSARTTPAPSLDDIDQELVERALGRQAVDDLEALRRIERELQRQGYLQPQRAAQLELTAAGRAAARARPRCAGCSPMLDAARPRRPRRARRRRGGRARPAPRRGWQFGDEQPLDVVRTVRNAVLRRAARRRRCSSHVEDFEVVETERRTSRGGRAAGRPVVLDGAARHLGRGEDDRAGAALAGHHEVPAGRDRDHRVLQLRPGDARRRELAGLDLGHGAGHQPAARADAGPPAPRPAPRRRAGGHGRHRRRADRAPVPRTGTPGFAWPPLPETLAVTLAEVERCTRRGATINVFMLDDEPRAGRVRRGARPGATAAGCSRRDPERLGEYVVSDYLRARRGRRSRRAG